MTKLIDLSHNINNDMPVHPYDEAVKLYQDKFLLTDKYNNFKLETGMHIGTHIDSPMHMTLNETFLSEIPVERFWGKGCLLDVRNESIVEYKEDYSEVVKENDIVLLYTGHSVKYGKKEYYSGHPVITEELAEFLISKNIKMVGMDLPSPDRSPYNLHRKLLENDIFIIENLTNLSSLLFVENFEVIALPLKIRADASLTRVVARF
ncbi:MAG: cyclase family protein [Bacillota bacterium]